MGKKVKLREQFHQRANEFQTLTLTLYGKEVTLSYLCLDLLWKPVKEKVRFVLVKDGSERFILMCSNLQWLPGEIIQAYSYRFKIEVTFKGLKHLLGSFFYRFWTKAMPKLNRKTSVDLSYVTDAAKQRLIAETVNAIEGFVNFGCIAFGILQILALNYPITIWRKYTRARRVIHPGLMFNKTLPGETCKATNDKALQVFYIFYGPFKMAHKKLTKKGAGFSNADTCI